MKHYWAMKHEWQSIDSVHGNQQLSTVQFDVKEGKVYNIVYANENGEKENCIIVHSSVGAIERCMYAILEEALKLERPVLPLWLSPVQLRILPVNNNLHLNFCEQLNFDNIRYDIDDRNEKLGKKLVRARQEWVPYVIVIGDNEVSGGKFKVNDRLNDKVYEMDNQELEEFIKKQIGLEGYPPSVREICAAVGLSSPSTIQRYINSLEEKGFIVKGGSKKRAITLPKQENEVEVMSVPVVGTVAAGQPILAEENIAEYFPLPMNYAGKKDMFMLKVRGESMINAGILDGDFVIVESADTARNGEIVVALLEDSATVKTYYREKEYIRLQPENDALEPIISKDVKILGKVSGVFRKY